MYLNRASFKVFSHYPLSKGVAGLSTKVSRPLLENSVEKCLFFPPVLDIKPVPVSTFDVYSERLRVLLDKKPLLFPNVKEILKDIVENAQDLTSYGSCRPVSLSVLSFYEQDMLKSALFEIGISYSLSKDTFELQVFE